MLILRSLMVRICGFHPQDPGSIPGVEEIFYLFMKQFKMILGNNINVFNAFLS